MTRTIATQGCMRSLVAGTRRSVVRRDQPSRARLGDTAAHYAAGRRSPANSGHCPVGWFESYLRSHPSCTRPGHRRRHLPATVPGHGPSAPRTRDGSTATGQGVIRARAVAVRRSHATGPPRRAREGAYRSAVGHTAPWLRMPSFPAGTGPIPLYTNFCRRFPS